MFSTMGPAKPKANATPRCLKELCVRFPKRQEFMQGFQRNDHLGVLFIETARRLELAEQVLVRVDFPEERRSFRVQGKVIHRRRWSEDPKLPTGVDVQLLSGEERTLQLILDTVAGRSVRFSERSGARMACMIAVSYRREREFIQVVTEDVGEGGVFIVTNQLLPVGTEVECKLSPPGSFLGLKLKGRVAWTNNAGRRCGMGIQFLFASNRQRCKLRQVVEKLAGEAQERPAAVQKCK